MLAGLGARVYRDVPEAIDRCVRFADRFEPDPATGEAYEDAYAAFQGLMAAEVARRHERPA